MLKAGKGPCNNFTAIFVLKEIMRRLYRITSVVAVVVLAHLLGVGKADAQAQEDPCAKSDAKPDAATPERIKQRAQSIRELKALLADADGTVRLAALDTMLKACDAATREIAYEAGFASGDQAMRALAFKHRILSWSQFVVEALPVENPSREQANLLTCCLRVAIHVEAKNLARGEFTSQYTIGTVSGLELAVTYGDLVLRLRLQDGGAADGTLTRGGTSVPARLMLR